MNKNLELEKIQQALSKIESDFDFFLEEKKHTLEKNEKLILYNFIESSASYIKLSMLNYNGTVQVLALSARSLYEIRLWLRFIKKDKSNMNIWIQEAKNDYNDILNCFINLIEKTPGAIAYFNDSLSMLKNKKSCINNSIKQRIRMDNIASQVGEKDEYAVFYKFFSKLAHPTSYLVNSGDEVQVFEFRKMLLCSIEKYSQEILEEVKELFRKLNKFR